MVNIANDTKLFTPKNIRQFAKEKAKLLYAILGQAIPGTDNEYSTIGLALTPEDACGMCEECMGDAIEVWVIEGDRGIRSEKWEPGCFKEHFNEVVEYSTPSELKQGSMDSEGEDDDDAQGDDGDDTLESLLGNGDGSDENVYGEGDSWLKETMDSLIGSAAGIGKKSGIGIEMPMEVVLGKALLGILQCEQLLSKTVATTSYMTGHPIDINALLEGLHTSIANILKAFSTSKGGFDPKFHKKDGVLVPYWTKTQIKQAKIKG
jgi:hypothetical protein